MIDLFEARFPLSTVAAITGWPHQTLRANYISGTFTYLEIDAQAHKPGATTRLSGLSIIQLAIAAHMNACGVTARAAWLAGLAYTDIASHAGANPYGVQRQPGQLFDVDEYQTLLVWAPENGARVLPAPLGRGISYDELIDEPGWKRAKAVLVVRINDIVTDVIKALNSHAAHGVES